MALRGWGYNCRIMLKILAIFTLFLLVFPMQTNAQTHKAKKTAQSENPTSTAVPVAAQQPGGADLKPEQQNHVDADVWVKHTPEKDAYDKASVWVNVCLGVIGIGGIVVAIFTLKKVERQTKATEDSAKASFLNVQALVNAERARIGFDVREMGRSFGIDGKNVGKTAAKITYAHGFSMILSANETLPLTPCYVGQPDDDSEWIGPDVTFDLLTGTDRYGFIADLSDTDLCFNIRDKKSVLWVFGCIRYFDGVSEETRDKRFCFATSVSGNPLETYLFSAGPEAYRKDT